jgi:hypothetical protein
VSGREKLALLVLMLLFVVGCGGQPTATPDLVATEVAIQTAAIATLTAEAATAMPSSTPTEPPPPTATVSEPSTPTETATLTPIPTPTPAPPTDERYTVVNVEADDVLNVRSGPGVGNPIVGTIPPYGMEVHVTGAGQQVSGSLWVPIGYQGTTGWVNSHYLARQVGSVDEKAVARAAQIIMALKRENLETLATLVHPDKGLRLSPYTYVRSEDLIFDAARIEDLFADQNVYTWGVFDGTGEPINFTFRQYFDRFIYDVDFARPHVVGFDETIGMGNTINNIAEVYPQAVTIEYHFEGFDPQFTGLDWRSLRVVLESKEGTWYLVGIVHDEWTI